ncbi:hypothetical protein J2T19_002518 [Paenibacillus tundrae]|uniref:Uncharacterized protein n=1 Tax=Paenibacillus tundrae TaxID=528187 RepID=A0ABT9WCU6_9BACL|nr:hypothetical protein [Paenibacillus tundrae]
MDLLRNTATLEATNEIKIKSLDMLLIVDNIGHRNKQRRVTLQSLCAVWLPRGVHLRSKR